MNFRQVMSELKAAGTAQNRKIYKRHGVQRRCFGVSYANQGKLVKRIKTDHDLALKLWSSGIHDARILATMVADPGAIDSATVDAWMQDVDDYVVSDAFAGVVSRSRYRLSRMKKWMRSRSEWKSRVGWLLVAATARSEEEYDASIFEDYLATIEAKIHKSPNRTREAMNTAVINIGLRSGALEKKAIAVAKRIGKVEVDHGETSCKTPDAIEYIRKTKAHRKAKAQKAAARKQATARKSSSRSSKRGSART